jgi:hypothetical protein
MKATPGFQKNFEEARAPWKRMHAAGGFSRKTLAANQIANETSWE